MCGKLLLGQTPSGNHPFQITDVDGDLLLEVMHDVNDTATNYEQTSIDSPPDRWNFGHVKNEFPGTNQIETIHAAHLDGDSLIDFLYWGSEVDTCNPACFITKTYIAEFNPEVNNFERVWSIDLGEQGGDGLLGGYTIGDHDGDGLMEGLASELFGGVYLFENCGDNSYAQVWGDTLPFVNVYYHNSGDVDNDGKAEFFVGATMSNGNWTTVYEADSNDHYSQRFLFHLLSGGSIDNPTYLTTDIEGDGQLELIILSGAYLYMFKSDGDDSYYLWYLRKLDTKHSVETYDINGDGLQDFVISKLKPNPNGRGWYVGDIYLAGPVLSVSEPSAEVPSRVRLHQNYPNPFNPNTTISFELPESGDVSLRIFNLLGEEVANLVSGHRDRGLHRVQWNASSLPSGVYYYRLQADNETEVRGMLFVK